MTRSATTESPEAMAPPIPEVRSFRQGLAQVFTAGWRPSRPFLVAALTFLVIMVCVAGLVLHGVSIDNPDRWFHEGKAGTILSMLVLGVAAFFCFRTAEWYPARDPRRFWIAFGVIVAAAAADEILKIHEHIGIWTHQMLGLDRHNSSLRGFESYLVLAYPTVLAVIALRAWRHVLALTPLLRWLGFGAGSFAFMALEDLHLVKLPSLPNGEILWEEIAKLVAGASLLAGVLHVQPRFRGRRPRRLLLRRSGKP